MHSSKAVNTEDGSPIDSDNEDSPFRAVDTKDSPSKMYSLHGYVYTSPNVYHTPCVVRRVM